MTHEMNLQQVPFDKIKSGKKIYELRLYDEKRRTVAIGDEIVFTSPDGEKLYVRVTDIRIFDSFADMYSALDHTEMGYSRDELASPLDMEQYYPQERQQLYGAVAFKIELI